MSAPHKCPNCDKEMKDDGGLFCPECSKGAQTTDVCLVPKKYMEKVTQLIGCLGLLPFIRDATRGTSVPVRVETIDKVFEAANACGVSYSRLTRDEAPAENPTAEPPAIGESTLSLAHVGSVELHNAFLWDCPHCGSENFQRGITVHAPPKPDKEISFDEDDDDDDLGVLITFPNFVRCRDCRQRYRAANLCIGEPE